MGLIIRLTAFILWHFDTIDIYASEKWVEVENEKEEKISRYNLTAKEKKNTQAWLVNRKWSKWWTPEDETLEPVPEDPVDKVGDILDTVPTHRSIRIWEYIFSYS